MTMPVDLVLVRHGESEGNAARRSSMDGDNSVFTEEFCSRHNSRLRLTDRGREQARVAGSWLKQHISPTFDRYLVSGYLRAMETASLLDLPEAAWFQEFYLRERDMGLFEMMPEDDKKTKHPDVYRQYKLDPFYWTPPNGESIAQLCLRIDRVLHTLHRECSNKRVLVVCHGLVMWAFMVRIERLTPTQFLERSQSGDIADQIRNCQIVHYTRRNPTTEDLSNRVDWVRSICPWDTTQQVAKWRLIKRPTFTNEQLRQAADASPRIMAG
jgi:NAD+ kinase